MEDSAVTYGLSPQLSARFAGAALGLERSGVSLQALQPGARVPFGHRHREQEELYVVLAGGGRLKLDDQVVEVRPLDAVRIPPGTMRCLEAGPEGLQWLAFGAPATGPGDAEIVQGWWSG
ncbi:MAG TPA: cupin domain-containing protein [Gaiellaceae bacterium]|nr:cupin domain-containing protein [Gaiellaceae bacterium]